MKIVKIFIFLQLTSFSINSDKQTKIMSTKYHNHNEFRMWRIALTIQAELSDDSECYAGEVVCPWFINSHVTRGRGEGEQSVRVVVSLDSDRSGAAGRV